MKVSDLRIRGANTNNLKAIDLDIPLGQLAVVTGVSGSGKSSLVFDTIYAEAYRRYVESLSSFARQYLKALPKPAVKLIENLPPAIAVKQARSSGTSRSTVGTMTELTDLLRVIFTHLSSVVCPDCHIPVKKYSIDLIVKEVIAAADQKQLLILAPLSKWSSVKPSELKSQLEAQGFTRVLIGEKVQRLDDTETKQLSKAKIVVDRVVISADQRGRVAEAVGLALKVGLGEVFIQGEGYRERFLTNLSCKKCERSFPEATLSLFSFNHPLGACSVCQGFGYESAIDWEKVFPDLDSSLKQRGVAAWNFGSHMEMYDEAALSAKSQSIDVKKPFASYTKSEWNWLKNGDAKKFGGVTEYFKWLETKRHKAHYRIHAARFRKYVVCSNCHGARLKPDALAYRIDDKSIADVGLFNISQFADWLQRQETSKISGQHKLSFGLPEAFSEIKARTSYLQRVGLSYLTLMRQTRTLSGGEQQRINMARCLGSALTDTLYCLDEPTAGLHARDSHNLLSVLKELRDQGNTVVVVEHEQAVISGADYLVEIGPSSGHLGGYVNYAGDPKAQHIYGSPIKLASSHKTKDWIQLKRAATHNLKDVDVEFPVGELTVVCGVSGSGKTSLVQHTLYPMLAKMLGSPIEGYVDDYVADSIGPEKSVRRHSQVVHVSQASLGRSSRSNIATYLGIYEFVRKALAQEPRAKQLGLQAGHFSFNTEGGRCENCRGLGTIVEDLSFLGEMEVLCPVCKGKRFSDAVLSVHYAGKNLSDILAMTIAEMRTLFFDVAPLARILQTVIDLGLGYITVGQTTSSFSGGEAQRLKLLRLLTKTESDKPSILIFDEPTTGLSDKDVDALILHLRSLSKDGHTLIVVEHHLRMIGSADWVVEIGPEAAADGGTLVFAGTPADLIGCKTSMTASFLAKSSEHGV